MNETQRKSRRDRVRTILSTSLLAVGLLTLFLITGCRSTGAPSDLERAVEAMDRGRYEDAGQILDEVLVGEAGQGSPSADADQSGKDW